MVTFSHGKFYDNGNPMPLEFGNRDQIRLIANVQALHTEGALLVSISDTEDKWAISCPCGVRLVFDCPWATEKKTCACGLVYVVHDDADVVCMPYVTVQ